MGNSHSYCQRNHYTLVSFTQWAVNNHKQKIKGEHSHTHTESAFSAASFLRSHDV